METAGRGPGAGRQVDIVFEAIGCAVAFLAVVSVITFVHELGHFAVARGLGMRIDTFAIGFGRELFGWTDRQGTRWKLCLLPLGGYVRMFGEQGTVASPGGRRRALDPAEAARSYVFRPVWQRACVVVAGPLANGLFAVACIAALVFCLGRNVWSPELALVTPGSPAAAAGLLPGDRVVSAAGHELHDLAELRRIAAGRRDLALTFRRGDEHLPAILRVEAGPAGRSPADLGLISAGQRRLSLGLVESIRYGIERTAVFAEETLATFAEMIAGTRSTAELAGPLRIAHLTGDSIAAFGIGAAVLLAALLSINIGIINLLPIPVLDGGQLVFLGLESLRGRPLSPRMQRLSALGGLALIVALSGFTTVNDLLRL